VYVNSDCEKMHGDYRIKVRYVFVPGARLSVTNNSKKKNNQLKDSWFFRMGFLQERRKDIKKNR
jgi:hypothetical protein